MDSLSNNPSDSNYTLEEIKNVGKLMTQKPLFYYVAELLKSNLEFDLAAELINLTEYDYCGYISLESEFFENNEKMHISLSVVPKNHKTEIMVPTNEFAKELYDKYNLLKAMAKIHWIQFTNDYPVIFDKIKQKLCLLDLKDLKVDTNNPTTLYFDSEFEKRIGIICYYVDKNGKVLYQNE